MCCAIFICNYYVSVLSSQFFFAFTHKKSMKKTMD